jgi:cell wall-associated NlpC family hydrolase
VRLSTPRNRRRLGVLAGLAILVPTLAGAPAWGSPVDDKKAEAARISQQLDEQGNKLSANDERFNQARLKFTDVETSIGKVKLDLGRADERVKAARGLMSAAAVTAYVHGGNTNLLSHLMHSTNSDLVLRHQYLRFTAADQSDVIGEMRAARQDLTAIQEKLSGELKAAKDAADAADAARKAAADAEAAQQNLLSQVKGDLAGLVAQEAAKRDAAQQRPPDQLVAARPSLGGSNGGGGGVVGAVKSAPALVGPPPPAARGAAGAVSTAEAQIGKPYVYGAAGPDSFDCSGLMMFAWRAAGVSLSHSAQAQFSETTRVPLSAIQPGDILFFGSSTGSISHDAMYVGGGTMVEAPHTGANVRYAGAFRSNLVGAGRPG